MTHFSENERENRRENVVQAMAADEPNNNEQDNPKSESRGKFRFKSKKRSASIDEDDGRRSHRSRRKKDERSSRRSSKRRSHRSRAHKESAPPNASNDDPSAYDDTYDAGTRSGEYMDPNSAFIESLFDALADDEGAAYWEDVYGQPIHTYPNVKEGPEGELERMTDAEYAAYVQRKMWEKSHEYLAEERQKLQEEQRQREKEKRRTERAYKRKQTAYDPELDRESDGERPGYMRDVEDALGRGQKRKEAKKWAEAWQQYLSKWSKFKETLTSKAEIEDLAGTKARGVIPWPVDTGRWKHVEKDDVEAFFNNAPPVEISLKNILKAERVRWHPDKMQQRFGAARLDDDTLKAVTMCFQVIDRMWSEAKDTNS